MSRKVIIFIVVLVSFISNLGIALPYPILAPLFLNSSEVINNFYGIDPYILFGITLATYPIGLIFGSQLLGELSDKFGRRPVLIWSLTSAAAANFFSAWALFEQNFMAFLMSRFISGILEGNISVARAVITDIRGGINKAEAFSYVIAAGQVGWIVGPLIGGYAAQYGFGTPFYIAVFSNLLACVLVVMKLNETNSNTTSSRVFFEKGESIYKDKIFIKFLSIQFIVSLSMSIFIEFYPAYFVDKWKSSPQMLANINTLSTIAMVISGVYLLKYLNHKISMTSIFFLGVFFSGIMLVIFTFPDSINGALATLVVLGACIGLYTGIQASWFSKNFSYLPQGKMMGALMASFCVANAVVALFGGLLASINIKYLLCIGGALSLVASLFFLKFSIAFSKDKI